MRPLFEIHRDPATGGHFLQTALAGRALLEQPLLNKGSAFTEDERREFGLIGLLPPGVSTPEGQLARIYGNYRQKTSNLERYIHLVSLQDRNETAFYRLLSEHPAATLPIILDVGTNNQELLNDPLYVGWRHERIRGAEYDAFVETFVTALVERFPRVLLQWEDFARHNAARLLERYRDRLCSFNDDIQGTGAVALAVAMAGAAAGGTRFADQRVVLLGAGSAAAGITRQLVTGMRSDGLSEDEARRRIWLVDAPGLVHSRQQDLDAFKSEYARPFETVAEWAGAPG